ATPARPASINGRPRSAWSPNLGVFAVNAAGVCVLFLRDGRTTWTAPPPQAGSNPLFAAIFRTKWLLRERCAATCQRRRRPGQARRRQGWLQRLSFGAACRRHKENAGAAQSWEYGRAHVGPADG